MDKQSIKFNQYFNDWLYSKDGYYSKYKTIGKEGDFYTAVSSSKFFGGTIGKRVVDVIKEGYLSKNSTIVEIGAHHGYLLSDMVQFIYTLEPKLLDTLKFAIVERYEHLRQKQKEYFKSCFGDAVELIHYNDISEVKLDNAFVVANEIFDAFACDLVYTTAENQLQYAVVEEDKIKFIDNDDKRIEEYCKTYDVTKGEIAVGYEEFAKQMCNNIKKFEFVTFDYGEKYPRNDFSCRVYEKHNVYPIFDEKVDLKNLYKKSDITYDVNFSHVIDSFEKAGAINLDYTTQLKALVDFGIIELLEILHNNVDEKTYISESNKVKTLLNPTGMGDRFKMVSFRK